MYYLKINQRSEGTFLSDPSVTSKVITTHDLKLQQSNKDNFTEDGLREERERERRERERERKRERE